MVLSWVLMIPFWRWKTTYFVVYPSVWVVSCLVVKFIHCLLGMNITEMTLCGFCILPWGAPYRCLSLLTMLPSPHGWCAVGHVSPPKRFSPLVLLNNYFVRKNFGANYGAISFVIKFLLIYSLTYVGMDSCFHTAFLKLRLLQSFWCLNCSWFGQWKPFQTGFCVLLTPFHHSLSNSWLNKMCYIYLKTCLCSSLQSVLSPWSPGSLH